jgi:transglutaminase-like putative cysteine protease
VRLSIHHETVYRYSAPVRHSIQVLRLTPRSDPHQRLLTWSLRAPARLTASIDAFGNSMHTLVMSQPHSEIKITVTGAVDIASPAEAGTLPVALERVSPLAFLAPTRLTTPNGELAEFAARYLPERPEHARDFLALADAIEDTVEYRSGVTETSTTAAQALAAGVGVCQDHAHLFIACCRARGIPARYVSGYIDPGEVEHAASHAWVDAWLPSGWISLDVTHCTLISDRHCRLAVGRDYDSASPIRGVRTGGGDEALRVDVRVAAEQ